MGRAERAGAGLPCILAVLAGLWAAPLAAAEARRFALSQDAAAADLAIGVAGRADFRVFTLADPPRVVVDFRDLDLAAPHPGPAGPGLVAALRFGLFRPGWSRVVLDLASPAAVVSAGFRTEAGGEVFALALRPEAPDRFRAGAGAPTDALWDLGGTRPDALAPPRPRVERSPDEPLVVALDPGHGGIDPGAVRDGLTEKDIALSVGQRLAARLKATGRYLPVLTRETDVFVPLRERVRIAQESGAEVFLSLHVNTEASAAASGLAIYTLSDRASDRAAERLAAFENQSDVFAGLDLLGEETAITRVLLDIAQRETNHRSRGLAALMLERLGTAHAILKSNPHRGAGFEVLKAPDMPSLLIELGFLSHDGDRDRLVSPDWAEALAADMVAALDAWRAADAAARALARR